MKQTGFEKQAVKKLARLLRALSKGGAVLQCKTGRPESDPQYRIIVADGTGSRPLYKPEASLVQRCLREDLLKTVATGWALSSNGRLALRRLLAGTEPFAEQHQDRQVRQRRVGEGRQDVLVNDRSTPLGWLRQRKDAEGKSLISKTQFAAGERLARDFQFAGLVARTTSNWSLRASGARRSAPGIGPEMSENRLAAQQRVRQALQEVGGDLADILLDICCFQQGLRDTEKSRAWPQRSAKIILQIALNRLARHYGMNIDQQRESFTSRITHWGDEGYRPSIDGS